MTPQDEHVMAIGPWAWLGYVIAGVFALMFAKLWHSSRASELRALNRKLKEARVIIDKLEKINTSLSERNAFLKDALQAVDEKYHDLQQRFTELDKANGQLRTHVTSILERLDKERARSDDYFARVVQLETKFNIN